MPTQLFAKLFTSLGMVLVLSGCDKLQPGAKVKLEPVSITLFRQDQLVGSAHRHTLFVNNVEVGLISNGATKTFHFVPVPGKNILCVEAYDPFVKNPRSNTVALDVPSGGHIDASVKWFINGTGGDLQLEARVK
ncbi:hypothetical protein [Frigoriglobus tundricola]|uniref:Uncharacterized protein n=1 Tax=Frigoriglobus tundricola TaxID=2774151 RepID=A0A6M5YMY1_9BACT|nr:hypothetical protein [Frigoriglobus tundricola]QJW95407.1 hypothetical protein FTUN_2956 [Frigoriglobus tundricola]